MRTLDKYVLRGFMINFTILLVVMLLLIVVVSLIVNIDEFIGARHAPFDGVLLGSLYTIVDFYFPNLFLLYIIMGGLATVGALGFTFSAMARSGELLGMITGGVSLHRVALPVLVAGCVLSLLALPMQEWVIPPLAGKLARGPSDAKLSTVSTFSIYYAADGSGNLFTADQFDPGQGLLRLVTILERDPQGRVLRRITAESAGWNGNQGGWDLRHGQAVEPVRSDAGSIISQRRSAIDFFSSDLTPNVLLVRRAAIFPRLLGMPELLRMVETPSNQQATILRVIHSRFSGMVLNVLILLMALPFFLTREPVNFTVQAVKACGLCMGAWASGLMIMQAGMGNLNAVTTAWLPVVIYLPIAAWMLLRVKT